MTTISYREAIAESIARAMRRDQSVVLLGEDVGAAGGAFKTTVGLFEEFGAERVLDTPISEQAIVGAAIGAALRGLRPIAEIMFADFMGTCWDGLANHAAKLRYMSAGALGVPMVLRTHGGAGFGFGSQHSQTWENLAMAIPGLKVVMPASPSDHIGLFQSAIDDPDPVVFVEHKALFGMKDELPPEGHLIPLGQARTVRTGEDVTIVAAGAMVAVAEKAAEVLATGSGMGADVIDLRTLWPLDMEAVSRSLSKTRRIVMVDESGSVCGWSAEVAARLVENSFDLLAGPIRRVVPPHTPVPFAASLERDWLPSVSETVEAARSLRASFQSA